jgi:hypothetical protein
MSQRSGIFNLISNGFYAAIKRRAEANGGDCEPILAATTKSLGDRVEITIRDNGSGIPPEEKCSIPSSRRSLPEKALALAYPLVTTSSLSNMVGLLRSIRSLAGSLKSGLFCRVHQWVNNEIC